MAGLKWEKIKGIEAMNLGDGLLSEESKKAAHERMEILYLKVDWIIPNPKNELSMNGIEELAQQLKLSGLKQPLTVKRIHDESYMIITGHRRFEAIKKLMERGEWDGEYIPCIIENPNSMNLPIDDDLKEYISLLTTNQHRDKTESDILFESRKWHEIYAALRKAGVETFNLGKENGDKVVQQIKGVATRELVAEAMGTSPAQVAKIKKVDDQGSEKLKNEIKKGNLTVSSAEKIVSMTKKEQDDLIDTILEKNPNTQIKPKDVEVYKKNTEKPKKEMNPEDLMMIGRDELKKEFKEVQELLKNEDLSLNSMEYKQYKNHIEKIRRILQKASNN